MSATDVQSFLRFLTRDAKVPLATALSKVPALQSAQLASPEAIAKAKIETISIHFTDDKVAKQVLNAAKRINKKRNAGEPESPSASKRQRRDPFEVPGSVPIAEAEASLELESSALSASELEGKVFITNRAPLVLAFAATLLKFTMPEQPPSSRLSLAQAVVSMGSQSKAKYIGLQSGPTAEDEGWGEGQPTVRVMNRTISVLKRWGYEYVPPVPLIQNAAGGSPSGQDSPKVKSEAFTGKDMQQEKHPALWAVDLDKLKKLNGPVTFSTGATTDSANLPVYSPQAARAYLYRSFDSAPSSDGAVAKKKSTALSAAERVGNVACLLKALELLFQSWADTLDTDELDRRAWSWYVAVRPEVEHGVAGWGAKGDLRLHDILKLRRQP